MNTRPTPETDKHEAARDAMETRGHADYIATLELCREMEIKLAEAQATIETLEIRHAAVMLHTQNIVDEANQFREQRDRLAVALQECREDSVELLGERDWWQNEPRCDYQKRHQEIRDNVTRADEALAAVKGEEQ